MSNDVTPADRDGDARVCPWCEARRLPHVAPDSHVISIACQGCGRQLEVINGKIIMPEGLPKKLPKKGGA